MIHVQALTKSYADLRRGEFLLGRKEQGEVRGDIETPRTIAVETTLDMPAPADVESRL